MSGTGKCPAGCGKTVLWTRTRNGKNMPLNPLPAPGGTWIPFRGRAWWAFELSLLGEPWASHADAAGHWAHPSTCRLWGNRPNPEPVRGSAMDHLACMACGTIDATVRHLPVGDRCSLCRRSEQIEQPSTAEATS